MGEFITYNYKGQPTLNKKWGLIPITEKHVPSSNWLRTKDGEYFRYLDKERTKTQWAPKGLRIYDKNSGMTAIIGDDYRAKRYLVSKKSVGTTPKLVSSAGKKDLEGRGGTKARVAIRKPRPTNVVLPGYTKPDDITDIQAFLRDYLLSDLKRYGADGIWGAETLAAYKKWKANRDKLINNVLQPKTTISDTSFDKPIDWSRNSFKPTFKLPERPLLHITDMYFGNSYRPYTFVNPILQLLKTPKIETTVPKIPAVLATLYVLSEIPSLATPEYVPTLNFNSPNYTTIFKNGGNILRFQRGNILIPSLEASRNDFANRGINWVKNKKAESEQLAKAKERANKNIKTPSINNTAELQNALWQIGAFKGLKDRHGRAVVYNTATDGIMGPVTLAAIAKAKQMGYKVDLNKGIINKETANSKKNIVTKKNTVIKKTTPTENTVTSNSNKGYNFWLRLGNKISNLTGFDFLYTDSPNRNGLAIIDHMVNTNYPNNYVIADKANNVLYLMKGPDTLRTEEISSGKNIGDGYDKLNAKAGRYYRTMPKTSGAGIYNLRIRGRLPSYYNEQMADLYDGNIRTSMAFHAPAGQARAAVFGNNNPQDNRVSYGCWSGKCGVVLDMIDKKQITDYTPWFTIPELPGNYIREHDGELETVYRNAPKTYNIDGTIYNFRYNKQKFR